MRLFTSFMVSVSLATFCLSTAAYAQEAALKVQTQGNVSFVSGGVGDAEMEYLASVKKDYDVQIMSANSAGEYTGDIHLTIHDDKGVVALDTIGGPYIYAQLPAGKYTLEARYENHTQQHPLTIHADKPTRLNLRWN